MTILDEAAVITAGDRQRDYGHPLENHERIADLWRAYLRGKHGVDIDLGAEDAAWMMMLTKVAREMQTPKRDNILDVCGYARCLEQIHERRNQPVVSDR